MTKRKWEKIAERFLGSAHARWELCSEAKISIREARDKYDRGYVEMAQRRSGSRMELLVIKRANRHPPRHYFSRISMTYEQAALIGKWDAV